MLFLQYAIVAAVLSISVAYAVKRVRKDIFEHKNGCKSCEGCPFWNNNQPCEQQKRQKCAGTKKNKQKNLEVTNN